MHVIYIDIHSGILDKMDKSFGTMTSFQEHSDKRVMAHTI
jgi:hypothetical protein